MAASYEIFGYFDCNEDTFLKVFLLLRTLMPTVFDIMHKRIHLTEKKTFQNTYVYYIIYVVLLSTYGIRKKLFIIALCITLPVGRFPHRGRPHGHVRRSSAFSAASALTSVGIGPHVKRISWIKCVSSRSLFVQFYVSLMFLKLREKEKSYIKTMPNVLCYYATACNMIYLVQEKFFKVSVLCRYFIKYFDDARNNASILR